MPRHSHCCMSSSIFPALFLSSVLKREEDSETER
uniref:Uncharacterized protein n=2 Tax=Anguilla anguilla TaxID=7936 RepID=A0A0E9QZI3_ANGAN